LKLAASQGRQFAALLPHGGSILYIQGPAENSAAKERTIGMQETKPANIHCILLRAQWTEESAQRSAAIWLKLSTSQKAAMTWSARRTIPWPSAGRKAFEELANESEPERWLKLPFTGAMACRRPARPWVRSGFGGDRTSFAQHRPGHRDACRRHPRATAKTARTRPHCPVSIPALDN